MALEYRTISGSTGSPVEVVTRDGAQHADPIPVLSADDTLPPTPIEDLVAAAGLQVHVLAADTAVRDGVRRACGERYAFTVADDWTSLLAEIDAGAAISLSSKRRCSARDSRSASRTSGAMADRR